MLRFCQPFWKEFKKTKSFTLEIETSASSDFFEFCQNSWKFSKSKKTRKCSCHFSSFKDKGQTGNWKGNSTGKNVDCSLFPLEMHWFLLYYLLCKLCVMHSTFLICQKMFSKRMIQNTENRLILLLPKNFQLNRFFASWRHLSVSSVSI